MFKINIKKIPNSTLFLVAMINLVFTAGSYKYSLPGDALWPNITDFQNFKSSITGQVYLRGDSDYKPFTWNTRSNTPKPAAIVVPISIDDIIKAVKFAKDRKIRISVASTGHHQDVRNILDNSIHINLTQMKGKTIDIQNKRMTVQTGNNFGEIHAFIANQTNKTLVPLSGADPGVGPYGWAIGGGHGRLSKMYGYGVDALVSVDLLLANLTIVTASDTQNKELFRALRGSGGNSFGIATSLTFKLFDSPDAVSTFHGFYTLTDETADLFADWLKITPNEAGGYYINRNFPFLDMSKSVEIVGHCFGSKTDCNKIFSPLYTNCLKLTATDCSAQLNIFKNFYDYISTMQSDKGSTSLSLYNTAFNNTNINTGLKEANKFVAANNYTMCSINCVLGGVAATLDTNREDTSISPVLRNSIASVSCAVIFLPDNTVSQNVKALNDFETWGENTLKKFSPYVYWNEAQHNFPSGDWKERYWGGLDNYSRMLKVKQSVDSEDIFNCYHCIGYDEYAYKDPAICPSKSCSCSNNFDGSCSNDISINGIMIKYSYKIILITILLLFV